MLEGRRPRRSPALGLRDAPRTARSTRARPPFTHQLLVFFVQFRFSRRKSLFVVPPVRYPCAVTAAWCSAEFRAVVRSFSFLSC